MIVNPTDLAPPSPIADAPGAFILYFNKRAAIFSDRFGLEVG